MTGRQALRCGCTAALLVASWFRTVSAAEAPGVFCPALDEERAAALSARLQADLAVRAQAGRVLVTCDRDRAFIAFLPAEGTGRREEILLPPDGSLTVERVLEVVDRLLTPVPVASTDAVGAGATQDPASVPEGGAREAPIERAPAEQDRAASPRDAVVLQTSPDARWSLGLHVGGAFEGWSGEQAGGLGPSVGVHLYLVERWRPFIEGGARWGVSGSDVGARAFEARAGADWLVLGRNFSAGVALGLTVLRAEALGLSDTQTVGAGELRARAGAPFGELQLWAGPTLALRTASTVVDVNGIEAFRIPAVTLGVSAELGLAVYEE